MSDLHWSTGTDLPILSLAATAALGLAASLAATWWATRSHPDDAQPPASRSQRASRLATPIPRAAHPPSPSNARAPAPRRARP